MKIRTLTFSEKVEQNLAHPSRSSALDICRSGVNQGSCFGINEMLGKNETKASILFDI